MDSPENLATLGTQDTRRKQTKHKINTAQYVLDTTIYKTKTNKTKTKHDTIRVGHHHTQTNKNNVNKT